MNNSEFDKSNLSEDFLKGEDGLFLAWAHGLYQRELDLQSIERTERSIDTAFYDGNQFTDDELAEYARRNQKARVFNEIKPTVDWLLGGERRIRADWSILPRTEDDSEASLHKTKLAKYIDDINNARWHRSDAYSDMVRSGEGWVRICYEPNADGDMQIKIMHEHWRYIIADSTSRRRDMSDMQYLWCTKVIPLETLANNFPDKASELSNLSDDMYEIEQDIIEEGLINEDLTDTTRGLRTGSMNLIQSFGERKGVKVYEMWYKQNETVEVLRGDGSFNNEIYDKSNPDHQTLLEHYGFRTAKITRDQIYCAMYTDTTVLYRQKSPYKHNRLPFVRRFAYLKDREGTPYGVIRSIRDPQSDLNIRRNKALFMLSSARVIMEKGAVESKEVLAEEVARWDAIIEVQDGKDLKIEDGASMANAQINVGEQNSAYIRQISGVTGENRGMDTNATSGIAIQARQEQGTVISTILTDMHSLARKMEGELVLSLIEQFMDKPFQFRITADNLKDKAEFAKINDESKPETDITKSQSDFIVAERDYRTTMRQALSEQFIQVAGTIAQHTGNPSLAVAMLASAIELQDLPDKDRYVDALHKAAGLPPPNESEEEKQQREQAEAEAQQKQQEMQQQQFELEVQERLSKINESKAKADKAAIDAELIKVRILQDKLMALKGGIEVGTESLMNHEALPIVDELITQIDQILNLNSDSQDQQPITQEQPPEPEQEVDPNHDQVAMQNEPDPMQSQPMPEDTQMQEQPF